MYAGAVLGIALRLNLHPQMTFSLLQVSQLLGDSLRCSPVDGKASMSSTVIENNTEFQTCWLMSLRNGLLSTYPEVCSVGGIASYSDMHPFPYLCKCTN